AFHGRRVVLNGKELVGADERYRAAKKGSRRLLGVGHDQQPVARNGHGVISHFAWLEKVHPIAVQGLVDNAQALQDHRSRGVVTIADGGGTGLYGEYSQRKKSQQGQTSADLLAKLMAPHWILSLAGPFILTCSSIA